MTNQYSSRPAPKEAGIAYIFMIGTLFGIAGLQHLYLGKILRGIIWLLTFGLFGIGSIIDIFTIPGQTRDVNRRNGYWQ